MAQEKIHFTQAAGIARQAGADAHLSRLSQVSYNEAKRKILKWSCIFDAGHVFIGGITFFVLAFIDCLLMMPMYRQVSEVITGDQWAINWHIALAFVCLAAVCSNYLALVASSGPFYEWQLDQRIFLSGDLATLQLERERPMKLLNFWMAFSFYFLALMLMVWLRSDIIDDTHLLVKQVELQLTLVGLIISICAIICGKYLTPLALYIDLYIRIASLDRKIRNLTIKTAQADQFVYSVWLQDVLNPHISRDMLDSVIRHKLRNIDNAYCSEITVIDEAKFDNAHTLRLEISNYSESHANN